MKKIIETDVLIIIEHVARELESACLLKFEFEKRGFLVRIVSTFPNKEKIPFIYKANIIFLPWIYEKKGVVLYPKCFLFNSPKAKLFSLQQEQYGTSDDENYYVSMGEARKVYHFSWGNKFTDALLKNGCDINKICTSGNIRLDFYKTPLSKLMLTKEQIGNNYNINSNKKWVLFIADPYHLLSKQQMSKMLIDSPERKGQFEIGINSRKDFLVYVNKYLSYSKNTIFIYRPHPSYATFDLLSKDIIELINRYPDNFFACSDGAINSWILSCDLCLSFISTSFIECLSASVPYYLIRSEDMDSKIDYPFFVDYKYTIHSYNDFLDALQMRSYDYKEANKSLSYYYDLSGFAYKKIVDFALKVTEPTDLKPKIGIVIKYKGKAVLKDLIKLLSKIGFIKNRFMEIGGNRASRLLDITNDSFSNSDISNTVNRIAKCFNDEIYNIV